MTVSPPATVARGQGHRHLCVSHKPACAPMTNGQLMLLEQVRKVARSAIQRVQKEARTEASDHNRHLVLGRLHRRVPLLWEARLHPPRIHLRHIRNDIAPIVISIAYNCTTGGHQ